MTRRPSEPREETQSPHNAARKSDQDGAPGERLSIKEEGGPVPAAQLPADPLLELYQEAAEEDLRQRLKVYRRLETMERHKQKKAGHAGELTAALELPRRYWPAVHEAAIKHSIPIQTERLPRGVVSPVCITTTESGALRLRAALEEQRCAE